MTGRVQSGTKAAFEQAIAEVLQPLGFRKLAGTPAFVRRSESLFHIVRVVWKRDESEYAWVYVGAWHPVLEAEWSEKSELSPKKLLESFVGDRLGESYLGSNMHYRCGSDQEAAESGRRVGEHLRAGALPVLAAIRGPDDVLRLDLFSSSPRLDRSSVVNCRGLRRRAGVIVGKGFPKELSNLAPIDPSQRYEISNAASWIKRCEPSGFGRAMGKAGFAVVQPRSGHEFESVVRYARSRSNLIDFVSISFAHQYGARSHIQCLTWIPEFNGLSSNVKLADIDEDFSPESLTAWWLGPDGLTDREVTMNFLDTKELAPLLEKLGSAFPAADLWMRSKKAIEDLFEFPAGAIETAKQLGVQSYESVLNSWKEGVMASVSARRNRN